MHAIQLLTTFGSPVSPLPIPFQSGKKGGYGYEGYDGDFEFFQKGYCTGDPFSSGDVSQSTSRLGRFFAESYDGLFILFRDKDRRKAPTKNLCQRTCSEIGGPGFRGVTFFGRPATEPPLLLTAVMDGPLSGGLPKAVEIAVLADVDNLSMYRIDVIFNGGTSTQSCALSGSASAGTSITVSKEAVGFESYFGSAPDVICASLGVNGDDVVELYNDKDNTVIDAYGVLGVDGTGEDWEYTDGFAYRISGTANGGAFDVDEWFVSGPGALDGCMTNSECEGGSVPLGLFQDKKADCACHYDDGHAPDCPSSMDIDGREFDCAKSEAGAASGPISGTIRRPPGAVGEFGSARCYIAVDSYGGKSGKSKGEYYSSSRSGLRSLSSHCRSSPR